jgi:hypothetical protein
MQVHKSAIIQLANWSKQPWSTTQSIVDLSSLQSEAIKEDFMCERGGLKL